MYKQQLASFWTVDEVDLSNDLRDWRKLTGGAGSSHTELHRFTVDLMAHTVSAYAHTVAAYSHPQVMYGLDSWHTAVVFGCTVHTQSAV